MVMSMQNSQESVYLNFFNSATAILYAFLACDQHLRGGIFTSLGTMCN